MSEIFIYLFVCRVFGFFLVMLCSLAFLFLLKMFFTGKSQDEINNNKNCNYIFSVAYQVNLTVTIIFTSFFAIFLLCIY